MAEVYRIAHQGEADGQTVMNITWWKKFVPPEGTVPNADLIALLSTVATRYRVQFVPLFAANYTYRRSSLVEVNALDLDGNISDPDNPKPILLASRQFLDLAGSGSAVGTADGEPLPNTISGVVHWDTGRYGRRRRGRVKLGPFSEGDSNAQRMTAGLATAVSVAAGSYRDSVEVGSPLQSYIQIVFSVTSFFEAGIEPGNPWEHGAEVINHTVQSLWGTQRTRKLREGTT